MKPVQNARRVRVPRAEAGSAPKELGLGGPHAAAVQRTNARPSIPREVLMISHGFLLRCQDGWARVPTNELAIG